MEYLDRLDLQLDSHNIVPCQQNEKQFVKSPKFAISQCNNFGRSSPKETAQFIWNKSVVPFQKGLKTFVAT